VELNLAKRIEPIPKAEGSLIEDALSKWPEQSAIDLLLLKVRAPNFVKEVWARRHYKAICDFSDDLMWIRSCKSLDDAKSLLQLKKLVWADEYALKVIIETYSLICICIFIYLYISLFNILYCIIIFI
jgi:hypothetical protein